MSVKQRSPQPSVLNRQNQDGQNTNKDQMKNSCPFYIVFQVLKVLLINISKIKPPDLLILVAFISFYMRRYQSLELYSTLSEKKISVTDFPFLTDSLNHPQPHSLNGQNNPLNMTKVFVGAPSLRNSIFQQLTQICKTYQKVNGKVQ